jgi:hypothetical protein
MWADALQAAERAHLLRVAIWSGASLFVGATLLVLLRAQRHRSALLDHFGIQTAAWGTVGLTRALLGLRSLELHDLAGATRLDRFLWLSVGLDVGFAMVGITLLVLGWRFARHPGFVGAGIAVIVQGAALALLNLVFAGQIGR